MGYRGKLREQEEARRLRAAGSTLQQIATELHVSKSSVSLWVRDVPFTPSKRRYGPRRRPSALHVRKLAEIEECDALGRVLIGSLDRSAFLAAGVALYAGEGSKRDGHVCFANTDESMIRFFCDWFRTFFDVDEQRLRVKVYLHRGLDLDAAEQHWSEVTAAPREQFTKPYRAVADPSVRTAKHIFGCCYVNYSDARAHRTIIGMMRALLSSGSYSGVAQSAEQRTVNATAVGSSPTPGATATLRVPLFVPYATPDGNERGVA
jgi:hypothetical protein